MMKMEIVLDDEKLYADGGREKYIEMYTYVDQVAVGYNLTLQPIENGRLIYNARDRADDSSYVGLTYLKLVESKEFMRYCKEWLWIEINMEGKTIVENILKDLDPKKANEGSVMSDEFSYKQIAFDLDTKKLSEHFPRYNDGYAKLKNTFQKQGFEHYQGSVYISKEKMNFTQMAKVIEFTAKQHPWLGDCCKNFNVTNITKDN